MPWRIDGDYIIACSCDYGCPCNFNARPTLGFCEGCSLLRISDGEYNGVRLNELNCGYASKWSGPIYEGNGVVSFYIDERADADQRIALTQILTGQAGGTLFSALSETYSPDKMFGPHFVGIQINNADEHTHAEVDGRVWMTFERIRDKSTQALAPLMRLGKWFSYQAGGDQYTLQEFWVRDDDAGLYFNHPGRCAQYTSVQEEVK